ncbi:MAG: serine/threonine protein kinase, partial [Planctomycetota bacterium]
MRERSIFDLDPDQLDRLLSIGQDAGKEQGAEGQEAQVDQTRAKPARELEPASPQQSSNPTASLASVVEHPGGWIGQYKLLNILGEGGMGIVFLAEQERPIKRRVALKVIKPGMDSRRVIARFEAERQALALLDHPNIAHVHEAGTTDSGRPYFAMEYVDGLPITEHCDRHRLTIEERLRLFLQVCHAIHHAHQKGIIHRDIKPSNILVSFQDDQAVPKIIDFGVAKAINQPLTERTFYTEQGQLFGTPEYMSPEQADMATEDIDTRSDIYSLGVLLYVLLTGVLPFDAKDLREGGVKHIRRMIRETNPKTPSTRLTSLGEKAKNVARSRSTQVAALARRLHRELEWIPLKAMRKERVRRYRSASELADDVENYLRGDPLIAAPESTTYRAMKMFRKHRIPFAAGVITVASLVVGLVVAASMYFHAEQARADAQAVSDYLHKSISASLNLRHVRSKEITVRSVLDTMSDGLGTEFRDQPLFEASMRQQLAASYGVLGLYAKAELHAERAFEICRTRLGPENMTTVYSCFQVGWVHLLQSRYSEAEPLLAEALPRFKLAFGEGHYRTLWCVAFLGWVYNFQGRFPEAEELFKRGLDAARRTRVGVAEHPVAPFLMFSWAFAHQIQGRYQEAERLYLGGLEICGEWHDEELFLKRGLGALYWEMGRYDEAEE